MGRCVSLFRVTTVSFFVLATMFALALVFSSVGAMGNQAFADEQDSVICSIGKAVEQKVGEMTQIDEASEGAGQLPDVDYTGNVSEIMQNDVMLMGGCELISLDIALESMGIGVDLDSLIYDHLNMDGSFSTGYTGDPYYAGGGFAPGIAAAANGYLESIESPVRAYDITGASFESLADYIARGYPVLVWTTMYFDDPYFTGVYDEEDEWYDNEHCVVLYGFSDNAETSYVSDPLEGLVERETARFADIYTQCGNRAIILH